MSRAPLASGASATAQPPRLLDQLRQAAFAHFGRSEPGNRYADWTRRYILFHDKRHPRDLGKREVERFLEHVAHSEKDPLRCLEQAHEALMFLYEELLHRQLGAVALPQPPRLLDRVRHAARVRHLSPREKRREPGTEFLEKRRGKGIFNGFGSWLPAFSRLILKLKRNTQTLPRGCPRVELATNSDRSPERDLIVLKGRRGERMIF